MREERVKSLLLSLGVVFLLLFSLSPIIYMICMSLAKELPMNWALGELSLKNYSTIICAHSLHFLDYLRNSLIVSSVSALFAVAIASFAAFSITRVPTPGARVVLLLTLSVSMFPQISVVGYLFRLMRGWGWINTYPALITPYIAWTLPLMMWILVSFFSKIPHQLDKAAMIDGASPLYIFYKIILPLSAPALFSAFLLAFIFAFNEFMFALILTLNHHARTLPVGIALFEGLHGQMPWPQIMAASTLAVVPLLLLTIFFQRYIIGGLTKGAVKG